uniref:Uncharacterized protein n=1 Tax=Nicotiana tabacum TaxID=4097 RepID=A0A1S4C9M4_TOBAC|nr:PREDICTED: uncharacterized protein LOC107816568 [Nicotiana tabacum]
MAFAQYLLTVPADTSNPHSTSSILTRPVSSSYNSLSSVSFSFSSLNLNTRRGRGRVSNFPKNLRFGHKASVKAQASEASSAADAFTNFKHVLLPITDRNPYLSEGSRQVHFFSTFFLLSISA